MSSVIKQLQEIQADSHILYVTFHNYHWNVKGMQFFPVHEMTEKLYDAMSEVFDDTAERILQLGGTPLVTLSEIMAKTTLKEESKNSFDAVAVIGNVVKALEKMLAQWSTLSKLAEEVRDTTTMNMADDKVAEIEKQLWMYKATLA
ncbi:Dps family protein [Sulfurospirillum barnesii]|uniref:DNA-binding ferritin-like protein (Oxidative damage protectant) n=1 Tax=Sulfurospirillum barnesii (strain ATCC 700032 / DSM 10660 / SES-3) TaxID=760154 RepID=I3XY77_SULBS|nr:DNA starvation/stationary phase protection protein [Sulfurospirillum barnesii]AFL68901.1 DNA-binding ferritin-like protein (oxidative damage protectant) [Sulfurospirillum barnesii SES-3]